MPLVIDDAKQHPEARLLAVSDSMRAFLGVPVILSSGVMYGTLCAVDSEPYAYSQEEVRMTSWVASFLACAIDVTKAASIDPLTGMANEGYFMQTVDSALSSARPGEATVLFLNLDSFKVIHDSLGHVEGDRLLTTLARRLRTCVHDTDMIARLSGDAFAILMCGPRSLAAALRAADSILASLSEPIDVGTPKITVSPSIGIASNTLECRTAADLLKNADLAMYQAKGSGRLESRVFDPELGLSTLKRMELEHHLREALRHNRLRLLFQPIVYLQSGEVIGVETLTRWTHPDHGEVPPSEFIPLAEETGLIVELDLWVLQSACRQFVSWRAQADLASPQVSVNLSAHTIGRVGFVQQVKELLEAAGMEPEGLRLEITETALMTSPAQVRQTLRQLRELGVAVSLDDFGTGYSSLSYLRDFPVDCIKIDRSFIQGVETDSTAAAIVRAIISLGEALQMRVLGEGVETAQQVARLRELGCHHAQGYYFSKPVAPEQLKQRLRLCAD